jgi:hypothetical protein
MMRVFRLFARYFTTAPNIGCHFQAAFTNQLTQGQNPGLFCITASRQGPTVRYGTEG